MTPKQIELVQSTWAQVVPIVNTAADLFYSNLFEMDPSLRPIFPHDMTEQKKKLMAMLGTAVNGLKNLESIVPAVQASGVRHLDYKVTAPMYDTVGAALLKTLEQGLGDAWNDEVKEAWTVTYTTLASVMIGAADEHLKSNA
ncbi:MAG: hemin receptor [Phycisphaeraceae bacterium]|nr:hemin receptor [Phycisphaeraceae bacterium]